MFGAPSGLRALYDRDAAHETTLRNLLSAKGYESLDAVRKEGMDAGAVAARRAVLLLLLETAAIEPTADDRVASQRGHPHGEAALVLRRRLGVVDPRTQGARLQPGRQFDRAAHAASSQK